MGHLLLDCSGCISLYRTEITTAILHITLKGKFAFIIKCIVIVSICNKTNVDMSFVAVKDSLPSQICSPVIFLIQEIIKLT